jgi:hypothetical protein
MDHPRDEPATPMRAAKSPRSRPTRCGANVPLVFLIVKESRQIGMLHVHGRAIQRRSLWNRA